MNEKNRIKQSSFQLEKKIELLGLIGTWKDNETNRFWTRFNVFLLANSGLLASMGLIFRLRENPVKSFSLDNGSIFLSFILCIVGFSLCIIWLWVLKIAKRYETRWIKDMDKLCKTDNILTEYVTGYSDNSARRNEFNSKKKYFFKATTLTKCVPILFATLWVILFIAQLVVLLSALFTGVKT